MEQIYDWVGGNYVEIIASVLGLIGVWLSIKQNVWYWPVGLLNVILSLIVFYIAKLYADVLLQIFYIIMSIYGWYNWLYGGRNKTTLPVSRIHPLQLFFLIIISIISIALLGYFLQQYTDAALPFLDSIIAIWGVIGTYMQARKYLENWAIWVLTDLLASGIYLYKERYAFTVLYFIFTILAVIGYYQWKKDMNKSRSFA